MLNEPRKYHRINVDAEKGEDSKAEHAPYRAIRPQRQEAIEFLADDGYIEVTPKSIPLRKKVLDAKKRPKRWQEIRASAESSA